MFNIIALSQFVYLSLGIMAVNIIVKSGSLEQISPLAVLLAGYGVWLLIIPLVWMIYNSACEKIDKGLFSAKLGRAVGILINALIVIVFAIAILGS